jgi:hypothetical protein
MALDDKAAGKRIDDLDVFRACDRRHNRTITTTDALINADKFASSVLPGQAVLTLRLRLG